MAAVCLSCEQNKEKEDYSASQWEKESTKRQCNDCIEGIISTATLYTNDDCAKNNNRINRFPNLLLQQSSLASSSSQIITSEPTYYSGINLNYPNLRLIHRAPHIFLVHDFLTNDECNRLRAKASSASSSASSTTNPTQVMMTPSSIAGSGYGDDYRTSSQVSCTQREVPTLVTKLTNLLSCEADRLEKWNLIRYQEGAYYREHVDEDDGPDTMNGFKESQRLVSVICYLNHVPRGGKTIFRKAVRTTTTNTNTNDDDSDNDDDGVSIQPEKGMVVLHFPGTTDFKMDPRTLHEGAVAIDEKWILVTWMWLTKREVPGFLEEDIPRLSNDTI